MESRSPGVVRHSSTGVAYSEYVPAVLGTIVFLYGGLVFLQGGARELKARQPGMMTLISLAIGVAFIYSAAGLMKAAEDRGIDARPVEGFEAIPGQGVVARLAGRELHMGGPALLRSLRVAPTQAIRSEGEERRGETAVYLVENGEAIAMFGLADRVRDESLAAVQAIQALGMEVVILRGAAEPVAQGVAADLGIDLVFAEVLPQQKADKVASLQAAGKRVAMVGDGVNDAPALVQADIGIAIGAGTDVAVEAGDIVLVRSDPRGLARIVTISRATYRKMVQNLWWATGYNIVAIPAAAGALAPLGILLHPALGAVLMSFSAVVVALNAHLLGRLEL